MADCQLKITRERPQSASLLQVHQESAPEMAPLTVDTFGDNLPGHSATHGPRAYSISPTEWLLIDYPVQEVRRQLSARLDRALVRLTDVSAAFVSLKVEGAAARTVLASDIGAPWAARSSQPGQYLRTRLGQIEVVLHCVGHDAFELHVDRSVADHVEGWLAARHAEHFPLTSSHA